MTKNHLWVQVVDKKIVWKLILNLETGKQEGWIQMARDAVQYLTLVNISYNLCGFYKFRDIHSNVCSYCGLLGCDTLLTCYVGTNYFGRTKWRQHIPPKRWYTKNLAI
jgi:hypothetical protein